MDKTAYFNTPDYLDYLRRNCEVLDLAKIAPDATFKSPGLEVMLEYIDRLGVRAGQRLLEIGCGLGRVISYLQGRYDLEISGVDVSEAAVAGAKERLPAHAEFIRLSGAESVPFPDQSFDYVLCWGVFDLTDQGRALPEMMRVLRVGGALLLTGKNDRYFEDDEDALVAEEKSREKGIPNHFTDYGALAGLVVDNGGRLEIESFFERRGDFMARKVLTVRPDSFLEYCVVVRKEVHEVPVYREIANTYSKTWRTVHG